MYELRCERGADIARMIGLDEAAALAIRHLDEHWDGGGRPRGLAGEAISLPGRILCLAQTIEVFWQDGGRDGALGIARRRRGTWFDPALVDALAGIEHDTDFWASLDAPPSREVEPADRVLVADDDGLDRIAEAFARVVDAKSPYTGRHSEGVAEIAVGLGERLDLDADDIRTLRRAGLLHDLGKLAISNLILDKPGKLTEEEWAAVREHPALSERILARRAGLRPARPDRRQPPRAPRRQRLPARAQRPRPRPALADPVRRGRRRGADRRPPLPRPARPATVLEIMGRDAGTKLDTTVFRALEAFLPERQGAIAAGRAALPVAA